MITSKALKRTGEQCVSVSLSELLLLAGRAKELFFASRRVRSLTSGLHQTRLMGRGMEFAESRRYQNGDDIRSIDWKVTARTGKAHTKLFAAEKQRQHLICADFRSPMFFATKGVFKSVQTSLIAGVTAWSAAQAGNRIGGVIFNDNEIIELRPGLGKRGVLPYLKALSEKVKWQEDDRAGKKITTMDEAIKSLHRVAAHGSLITVISDFRQLTQFGRDLLIDLSRRSDLHLYLIYDPLEANFPGNGHYPVTDGKEDLFLEAGGKNSLEAYHQKFEHRRMQVAMFTQYDRVQYRECSTEEDCFEIIKRS